MHPDQLIAALRRERSNHPDKADQIEAEIRRVEALPRPETAPEDPVTRIDPRVEYIRALERELHRSERSRHPEIEAEIARAKAEVRSSMISRAVVEGDSENTGVPVARRGRPRKHASDNDNDNVEGADDAPSDDNPEEEN